jgi:hypothetical protein
MTGWPSTFDSVTVLAFVLAAVLLPSLGYVFLALDIRRYLRSLTRTLVRVASSAYSTPRWALPETPRCVAVFGLQMPCTQDDLMRAYREKVKTLHPDRGGDKRRFIMLQSQLQEAMKHVEKETRNAEGETRK